MLLCYVLLGESVRLYKVLSGLLLYLGLTLVVQPSFLFGEEASHR